MENTIKALGAVVICLVLYGVIGWAAVLVLDFLNEVPKQLKRIADALERRAKNGN